MFAASVDGAHNLGWGHPALRAGGSCSRSPGTPGGPDGSGSPGHLAERVGNASGNPFPARGGSNSLLATLRAGNTPAAERRLDLLLDYGRGDLEVER